MSRLLTTAFLPLLLAACETTRPTGWFEETRAIHFGKPFSVPESIGIKLGFDPMGKRKAFRDGDRLLYGLRLEKPGRERTWFVELFVDHAKKQVEGLEVEHELTMTQTIRRPGGQTIKVKSTVMEVSIRVYDGTGKQLSETRADVARESLALGFREAAARLSGRTLSGEDSPISEHDQELKLKTLATSVSLMTIIEKNEVLSPILWEVVAAPSFASLLFNFGASVAVDTQLTKSQKWEGPLPFDTSESAYRMPVEILANDQPALLASAIVVQPAEPINLSAGIFSIVGVHPNDPEIRVRLELLAARIGEGLEPKTFAEQRGGRQRGRRRGLRRSQ